MGHAQPRVRRVDPPDVLVDELGLVAGRGDARGGSDESGQTLTYDVAVIPSPAVGDVFLSDGTTKVTIGTYTLTQIQGMQFKPADDATGTTGFQFNVTDSGGTANGGADSISQFILITVDPVNDAPTFSTTNSTPTFTENAGAVGLFSGTSIDAVEVGDLIDTLTVTVDGLADGSDEILVVDGQAIASRVAAHLSATTS